MYDVAIVGAGFAGRRTAIDLLDAGFVNLVVLEKEPAPRQAWRQDLTDRLRFGREVVASVFDEATETWLLRTRSGEQFESRTVVSARGPLHVTAIPNLPGQADFAGTTWHSAQWNTAAPVTTAGKRVALIGPDVARVLPRLASAAELTIFHKAPNLPRVNPQSRISWIRNRLLRRRRDPMPLPANAKLVTSDVDRITGRGVRTVDGAEHQADVIVYATGYKVSDAISDETFVGPRGVGLRALWRDGAEAFAGVSVHGLPNLFLVGGPYSDGDQRQHIADCLSLLRSSGSNRIEVRRSAQRSFVGSDWRGELSSAYEVAEGSGVQQHIYDGAAVLTVKGDRCPVAARLTGHLDPIDGKYHWQGTVSGAPAELPIGSAQLSVEDCCAPGRVVERTPWGSYAVAGVGPPPFRLDQTEIDAAPVPAAGPK